MESTPNGSDGESIERTAVETPRGTDDREWEVFVGEDGPPRHVGSVSGPTAEVAREHAEALFGRWARDLWLCPADETRRYVAEPLESR